MLWKMTEFLKNHILIFFDIFNKFSRITNYSLKPIVPNHAWNCGTINWRLGERGLMLWTFSLLAAAEGQPR
jgi:hypothetical protein